MNATATAPALMTTEELLALPENGTERWLIRGRLREKPMTKRNRWHSLVTSLLSHYLWEWVMCQPKPRGKVYDGEAGCRLRRDPDTTAGIDVVYLSPELVALQTEDTSLIEGVPTLVAEVLSPNGTQEEIHEKIFTDLEAGVPLVWIINPYDHTIRVYRPDAEPELFNLHDEISAEPHLPGFRVAVAKIFDM